MKLEQATQNIDILIQNTRMTRQEHVELQGNLNFLAARAKRADEYEAGDKLDVPPVQEEIPVEDETDVDGTDQEVD